MSLKIMDRLVYIRRRHLLHRYGAPARRPVPMTDERLPREWREEGERRARERDHLLAGR